MSVHRPGARPHSKAQGADRPGVIKTLAARSRDNRSGGDGAAVEAVRAWWRWTMKAPESRLPAAGIVALYPTGGLADLVNPVPWELGAFALPAAGAAWVSTWKAHSSKRYSAAVTAGAAGVPLWLATASATGIWHMGTLLAYSVAGTASWGALHWSDVLRTRREMRAAQAEWKTLAAGVQALAGSRMVSKEDTPMGQKFLVDIRGAQAKTADRFPRDAVANEVAALFGLPEGRVVVSKVKKHAGLVTISVRLTDPWANAPVSPAIAGPDKPRSILDGPFTLGADPETGKPIELVVYDADGGRHIMVVAGTGGGKTNLFSCVVEQATACNDVLTMGIDLGSGAITGIWRDAMAASAGVGEIDKAITMLRWLKVVMEERVRRSGGIEHKPSAKAPVILVILDEMDSAIGFSGDRKVQELQGLVNEIFRRGRKAGVVVMIAGQRGVSADTGSRTPHANSTKILLRVDSTSEIMHVIPDWQSAGIPDMSSYGQGAAGVACVVTPDKRWQAGRTFHLDHKRDVPQDIARRRGAPAATLELWLPAMPDGLAPRPVPAIPVAESMAEVELDQTAIDRRFSDLADREEPHNVLELVIDGPELPPLPPTTTERVLAAVRDEPGLSVRQISDRLEIPRSTTHRHLRALQHKGLVTFHGQGGYCAVDEGDAAC